MTVRAHCSRWMSAAVFSLAALCGAAQADSALDAALAGEHRSEANRARDAYRHPVQTLGFFGIEPDMTVVELWPGRGWYTEVLAPYLRDKGKLYAAHFPAAEQGRVLPEGPRGIQGDAGGEPGARTTASSSPSSGRPTASRSRRRQARMRCSPSATCTTGSGQGNDVKVMQAAFAALKPGGVLGVVEHRAAANATAEQVKDSGYMTEEMVIKAAEAAGFVLEAKSEINANPRDTRDHPKGVWTLPPSLALGDTDREKYVAIGESDRMTLRFRKPAQ